MGRAQLKTQKLDNDNALNQWTGNFSAQPELFYINDQRISKKLQKDLNCNSPHLGYRFHSK